MNGGSGSSRRSSAAASGALRTLLHSAILVGRGHDHYLLSGGQSLSSQLGWRHRSSGDSHPESAAAGALKAARAACAESMAAGGGAGDP